MLRTEQTKGQSVFQHCRSVESYIKDLLDYIKGGYSLSKNWKLPDWIEKYKSYIINNISDSIYEYARYHDCGKPYCRSFDEEGNVHFYDHANISREVYIFLGGKESVANLIGWDMVLHKENAETVQNYLEKVWSKEDAITLLIAAISEVHSNSVMFGGLDSVGFKVKWKKIDKHGKRICKHFEQNQLKEH